jgi:hypothetical protein
MGWVVRVMAVVAVLGLLEQLQECIQQGLLLQLQVGLVVEGDHSIVLATLLWGKRGLEVDRQCKVAWRGSLACPVLGALVLQCWRQALCHCLQLLNITQQQGMKG